MCIRDSNDVEVVVNPRNRGCEFLFLVNSITYGVHLHDSLKDSHAGIWSLTGVSGEHGHRDGVLPRRGVAEPSARARVYGGDVWQNKWGTSEKPMMMIRCV